MAGSPLCEDAKKLFLRQNADNLSPYLYDSPISDDDPVRGANLYQKLIYEYPDYYLYQDETSLIKTCATDMAAYVPTGSTVIEFGLGTGKAFTNKTMPFLKAINGLKKFVAFDLSLAYLETDTKILHETLPEVEVEVIQDDFVRHCNLVGNFENPVVYYKGSTIANLGQEACIDFLKRLAEALGSNGLLIVGTDSNQSAETLGLAYDNNVLGAVMENVFYRIRRDCKWNDFDPNLFNYQFDWQPDIYSVRHILRANQAQRFMLDDQAIDIKEGDTYHILSSYKYPVDVFQEMAQKSNYKVLDHFIDEKQRMPIHVLQVQ